jgi:hypothetical protein
LSTGWAVAAVCVWVSEMAMGAMMKCVCVCDWQVCAGWLIPIAQSRSSEDLWLSLLVIEERSLKYLSMSSSKLTGW